MSNAYGFEVRGRPVAEAGSTARAEFIGRTYSHLFGALVAFVLVELAIFQTGAAEAIFRVVGQSGAGWLVVLGAFMVVGWLATRTAHTATSSAAQYAALFGYVVAEAVIFVPLLYVADLQAPGVISSAALVTLAGFTALTAIAFLTRKDFSFLRGVVIWGGVAALLMVVAGAVFGFSLGTVFSVAMVALAGAAILHDTSNVLLRYPEDRHVAAALQLFASVALMFWYVLRIFLASRD